MLYNARCGKLQCDVKCGVWNCGEECDICNGMCDCCAMSNAKNDATCCDVRCGGMM